MKSLTWAAVGAAVTMAMATGWAMLYLLDVPSVSHVTIVRIPVTLPVASAVTVSLLAVAGWLAFDELSRGDSG